MERVFDCPQGGGDNKIRIKHLRDGTLKKVSGFERIGTEGVVFMGFPFGFLGTPSSPDAATPRFYLRSKTPERSAWRNLAQDSLPNESSCVTSFHEFYEPADRNTVSTLIAQERSIVELKGVLLP